MVKLFQNPDGTVEIKIEARRQIPPPAIIDNHSGTDLRGLYYCFGLSPIFHSASSSFRKEKRDGSVVIAIAPLEESIGTENELQTVLCRAAFEEFIANTLRNEDR